MSKIMKRQSRLGTQYIECREACGICATNIYRLPYKLGISLFDMEESTHTKTTIDSLATKYARASREDIENLHTAIKNIINKYVEAQNVS